MDRIFFGSNGVDPGLGLPVYVLDSHMLPLTRDVDYDRFLPLLLAALPNYTVERYCLVFFAGALTLNEHILWVYGIKFFKQLTALQRERCRKVYVVHEKWWLKTVAGLLLNLEGAGRVVSRTADGLGPGTEVVHCASLAELGSHVDVRGLKISLPVYRHDREMNGAPAQVLFQASGDVVGGVVGVDDSTPTLFHFYLLLSILEDNAGIGRHLPNLFIFPGNKTANVILVECINRNQVFNINDWDLYLIACVFRRFLRWHGEPGLVGREVVNGPVPRTPLSAAVAYVQGVYARIATQQPAHHRVLLRVMGLFQRLVTPVAGEELPVHTPWLLAKAFAPAFALLSDKLVLETVRDVVTVMVMHWDAIGEKVPEPPAPVEAAGAEPAATPSPSPAPSPAPSPKYNRYRVSSTAIAPVLLQHREQLKKAPVPPRPDKPAGRLLPAHSTQRQNVAQLARLYEERATAVDELRLWR